MTIRRAIVGPDSQGRRLDRIVADLTGCGRRRARKLIEEGCVQVDDHWAAASSLPTVGAQISIEQSSEEVAPSEPAGMRIVWSNDAVLVMNKPAGVHSHRGLHSPCAADYTAAAFPETVGLGASDNENGIVHRLDCFTSGLLIAARNENAYKELRQRFASELVTRRYLALVMGQLEHPQIVEQALVRTARKVRAAREEETGLTARSQVRALENGRDWALLLVESTTGAPHQVRAHLSSLGLPLLGDTEYGGKPARFRKGQLLHAVGLSLHSEAGTRPVSFRAAAPGDFLLELASLRKRT
ncbi:MAG TPA: RluA family pseudouridine synthase [Deltaproteobacteria bacterium]|nr:RluA family pseudouridine synthase [Candidatus Binatota bacterium]HIL12276.1 RluA family pseudouridine synthase [Deltaproteobacteria bacterium]